MALLLAQARNIPQAHAALVAGRWERSKWEGVELHGKVLGVVGLGRAGSLVAQRAHAFGMELIGYDPFVSQERARAMGVRLVSIEELVAEADFVSIHTPKTPETVGLFGRDLLAKAKPGIRIVNTARGGIVDEEALADAIRDGIVAGAGLDVFAKEPCTESPLFELPGRRRLAASRRLDRGGAGQGRRHDRRAGAAGARRRLRPLRGQRGGQRRLRRGAGLHGPGRAAGALLRRPARRPARHHRDRVPGRAGRGEHGHPDALGPQGDLRRLDRGAGLVRQRAAAGRAAGSRRHRTHHARRHATTSRSSRCARARTPWPAR